MNRNASSLVSVVIPSYNRPELVGRAVQSVLHQTYQEIEIIVVIDGPDQATVDCLQLILNSKLRVLELPENVGPSVARNIGIKEARGSWIAFLDDDDEWLPNKIEYQMKVARHSSYDFPIVASRFIARSSAGDFVWPSKLLEPSENLSDYLFVRNSFFMGEKFILTSTLLIKKELLEKVPLRDLHRHEDWDWLLRTNNLEGVGIEFSPEELCIYSAQIGRKSLSSANNWRYSLEWIRSVRDLVTPIAYSSFIVIEVIPQASSQHVWKVFLPMLWEMARFGKPRAFDFQLYLVMWLLPQEIRQKIRSLLTRKGSDVFKASNSLLKQ